MSSNQSWRPEPYPPHPRGSPRTSTPKQPPYGASVPTSSANAIVAPRAHQPFRGRGGRAGNHSFPANLFKDEIKAIPVLGHSSPEDAGASKSVPSQLSEAAAHPDASTLRVYFDQTVPVESRMILAILCENQSPQRSESDCSAVKLRAGKSNPVAGIESDLETASPFPRITTPVAPLSEEITSEAASSSSQDQVVSNGEVLVPTVHSHVAQSPPLASRATRTPSRPIVSEITKLAKVTKCRFFLMFGAKSIRVSSADPVALEIGVAALRDLLARVHSYATLRRSLIS